MIRVELVKLLRRPRTWVTIAALNALPTLVAVLLAVTDLGPRPGTGPPFLSAVLNDGTLFPLAALGIVLPLFLPVAVAVVGGDAIAGEVQSDTLRYLLVRPVSRLRVLLAKLVSVVAFVVIATLAVAAVAYVEGTLLLGDAPATGVVSVSGTTLTETEMLQRTLMAFAYVVARHARGGRDRAAAQHDDRLRGGRRAGHDRVPGRLDRAAGLDAAESLRPYLLTRYWLAFVDLFRDPIRWTDLVHGVLAQLGYLVVFAGAAWANFATKDVNR